MRLTAVRPSDTLYSNCQLWNIHDVPGTSLQKNCLLFDMAYKNDKKKNKPCQSPDVILFSTWPKHSSIPGWQGWEQKEMEDMVRPPGSHP